MGNHTIVICRFFHLPALMGGPSHGTVHVRESCQSWMCLYHSSVGNVVVIWVCWPNRALWVFCCSYTCFTCLWNIYNFDFVNTIAVSCSAHGMSQRIWGGIDLSLLWKGRRKGVFGILSLVLWLCVHGRSLDELALARYESKTSVLMTGRVIRQQRFYVRLVSPGMVRSSMGKLLPHEYCFFIKRFSVMTCFHLYRCSLFNT